jgi:hypothetical protein
MLGISRPLKSICDQCTAIVAPFDGRPARLRSARMRRIQLSVAAKN